jgi:ferrochelatase
LGGPDSLEAIEPFLYNLFCDPDIFDFPFAQLAREPLARLISSRRAGKVRKHYQAIGGKSPIGEVTARQARALELELSKSFAARVVVAMRYWHPLTEAAIRELTAFAPEEIVLLPLYPQYSSTTTGSSLNEWQRQFPRQQAATVHVVRDFHNYPIYLDALVERIEQGLVRFRRSNGHAARVPSDVHLLFSAHSIPTRVIERGDPYQAQIEATVKGVMERGLWPNPHSLCYQSRGKALCRILGERLPLRDVSQHGHRHGLTQGGPTSSRHGHGFGHLLARLGDIPEQCFHHRFGRQEPGGVFFEVGVRGHLCRTPVKLSRLPEFPVIGFRLGLIKEGEGLFRPARGPRGVAAHALRITFRERNQIEGLVDIISIEFLGERLRQNRLSLRRSVEV